MHRSELTICVSTLLDDLFSIDEPSFDSALDAAAAAGFTGISWWSLHHLLLEQAGLSGDEQQARIAERELDVVCIEALAGWANASTTDEAVAEADFALAIADRYGAGNLVAVTMDAAFADYDQAVTNLTAVAKRAAASQVKLCVEFLPWTAIADLPTCLDLLRRTEQDNVTVLLDSWHWQRQPGGPGGANLDLLASTEPEYFSILQVCDALAEPVGDQMTEAMTQRPLPGSGAVDHAALLGAIDAAGAEVTLCPEVFNDELRAQGMASMAQAIADATRAIAS